MVIAARITSRITHPHGRHLHVGLLASSECSNCESPGNEDNETQHCQRPRAHLVEGVRFSTQKSTAGLMGIRELDYYR
jgi:predicted amidohydrolase